MDIRWLEIIVYFNIPKSEILNMEHQFIMDINGYGINSKNRYNKDKWWKK